MYCCYWLVEKVKIWIKKTKNCEITLYESILLILFLLLSLDNKTTNCTFECGLNSEQVSLMRPFQGVREKKAFFTYIHLHLFHSHPSIFIEKYILVLKQVVLIARVVLIWSCINSGTLLFFISINKWHFSGHNVQYCRVLFWPNLEEAMARDIHASGGKLIGLSLILSEPGSPARLL